MSLFGKRRPARLVSVNRASRVVVVDSNNLGWRSWHAPGIKDMTFKRSPDSEPVKSGHVFGFIKTALSFLPDDEPTSLIFAIDGHPAAKYERYSAGVELADGFVFKGAYKGQRDSRAHGDPMPDITDLVRRWPGAYTLHNSEEEADDMIASFIHQFRRNEQRWRPRGPKALIQVVTSDMDLTQVLIDEDTFWCQHSDKMISAKQVGSRMVSASMSKEDAAIWRHIRPKHIALMKALLGDSSDNIKGVPRLRRSPVVELLVRTDGSFEDFMRQSDALPKPIRERIESCEYLVRLNLSLTKSNVKLPAKPERNARADVGQFVEYVKSWGCESLTERVQDIRVEDHNGGQEG